MSILSKDAILKEMKKGRIKIEPFKPEDLGCASIDLTLDNEFRVFKKSKIYDVTNNVDYKEITKVIKAESIVLKPKETILGITKEKITLPDNIAGFLEGRSRFARLGLTVHITAPFMPPGISNREVLEITNLGPVPLRLHAGTKLCQFIFVKTKGKAKYNGIFSKQYKL